ncbi:MAG: hypothetical protein ACO1PI_11025 [Bacteroidota bacterium]
MKRLTWMDLVLEITETLPKEQYIVFGGRLYYFRYIDFSNEVGGQQFEGEKSNIVLFVWDAESKEWIHFSRVNVPYGCPLTILGDFANFALGKMVSPNEKLRMQ